MFKCSVWSKVFLLNGSELNKEIKSVFWGPELFIYWVRNFKATMIGGQVLRNNNAYAASESEYNTINWFDYFDLQNSETYEDLTRRIVESNRIIIEDDGEIEDIDIEYDTK